MTTQSSIPSALPPSAVEEGLVGASDALTPRWFVGAEGRFFGSHRPGHFEFTAADAAPILAVQGKLADELADACERPQNASKVIVARLRALSGSFAQAERNLIEAVINGLFRPARSGDMLRADGYHQLWIELLARCNERCVHCYGDCGPTRTDELARSTVLEAIADAGALGFEFVQLTGGDPLLCPFLLEAVAAARAVKLAVEVFTNGLLLEPPLLQSLVSEGVTFAFSLYGANALTHDAVTRTPGSFARTVDAIVRTRDHGAPLRIGVVVVNENAGEALKALEYARTLAPEPRTVRLVAARSVGRGRSVSEHLQIEREGLADLALRTKMTRPNSGRAALCADGEVRPCIFTRWLSLGRVGRDGTLAQILRAPQPRRLRRLEPTAEAFCADRLSCGVCRRTAVAIEQICHAAAPK